MKMEQLLELATANLASLKANPYPGRGLVIGMSEDGKSMIQVYWIMGRSPNSRNRVFVEDGFNGFVRTAAADPSKMTNPELIIYTALAYTERFHVVSNGDQTDTVTDAIRSNRGFYESMHCRQYEPDAPNWTPRITGLLSLQCGMPVVTLALLRKSDFTDEVDANACDRCFWRYEKFAPGIGHCITTYCGDGSPLPPFRGEPYLLPLTGSQEEIAHNVWNSLNEDNRVSLVVKSISLGGGGCSNHIINRFAETARLAEIKASIPDGQASPL